MTKARANPTLFFIPPLNSAGNLLFTPSNLTRAKISFTFIFFSSIVKVENISNGNFTLSSTVKESNKALP